MREGAALADSAHVHELVERAQAGDVRAFEQLIASHVPQVRRFAMGFARNETDAADVAQEALLKVYRSIRSYRFQSAFSTWLYAIVRNACIDAGKSRQGRDRASDVPLTESHLEGGDDLRGAPADERMAREQERARVWQALRALPEDFRTTLILFDIEGLSYDEVAAAEGVPLGTVKSRISRAREQLRRQLGAMENTRPSGNLAAVPVVAPAGPVNR